MGHPSNISHGEISSIKSVQKDPGIHHVDSDDDSGASYTIDDEDPLDGSKDSVAISRKGKEREPDPDAVMQSGSNSQHPR